MAYLVVADIPDRTVRDPSACSTGEDAIAYLHHLAALAVDDGHRVTFEGWGDPEMMSLTVYDGDRTLEIYRIIRSSDEEVLRMSHPAPPTSYSPPSLP